MTSNYDSIARLVVSRLPAELDDEELERRLTATRTDAAVTWRVLQLRADCRAARAVAYSAPDALLLCDDVAPLDLPRLLPTEPAAFASVCRQLLGFAPAAFATVLALFKCIRARLLLDDGAAAAQPAVLTAVVDWLSEAYADCAESERALLLPIAADIVAVYAARASRADAARVAQCVDLVVNADALRGAATVLPAVVNRIASTASLRASPLRPFLIKSLAVAADEPTVAALSTHDFLARHEALLHLLAACDAHERAATHIATIAAQTRLCAALKGELERLDPTHCAALHLTTTPLFNNDVALIAATRAALAAVHLLDAPPSSAAAADGAAVEEADFSGMFFVDTKGAAV